MPTIIPEKKLMHYLLGELSQDERTELEDRYLSDQDFFDRLLAAEDDLIDEYVQGKLSRQESQLFERNFLTSRERQDRLSSARALSRFVDSNLVGREKASLPARLLSYFKVGSPAMRFAVSAAMVILIVGVAGMWMELGRMKSQLSEVQSGQVAQLQREDSLKHELDEQKRTSEQLDEQLRSERSERGRLQQEVAKLREPQTDVLSEALGFGVVERPRGGFPDEDRKRIVINNKVELVRLRLGLLKNEYPGYLVTLVNEAGEEMWRAAVSVAESAKGPGVVVRLPSRILGAGKYSVVLSGSNDGKTFEMISEYPIFVVKK
jgi:hypothetical protein